MLDVYKLKPGDFLVNNQLPKDIREIYSIDYREEKIFLKRKNNTDNWDYIPFNSIEYWKEPDSFTAVIHKIKQEVYATGRN